jgi:DNA-binding response OmpR family regulator
MGKHILVVEDEYFIASDLKRALQAHGATIIGPVGGVDKALDLIAREPIDAAVLDVNLDGADSFPVADRLGDKAVPYMFVTGYDEWALPEKYRAVPRIAKPFQVSSILLGVSALLAPRVAS